MLPRQLAALSALQIYVCAYCALRLLCVYCCGVLVVSLFALVGVVVLGVRIVRTPLLCAVCVYFSLCCNVFACVCVLCYHVLAVLLYVCTCVLIVCLYRQLFIIDYVIVVLTCLFMCVVCVVICEYLIVFSLCA